ncbi:hypothetical protein MTO96_016209 [Rhipicephalus appendiculatus]
MLTMGYEPHVLKIAELCRPDRQTIMWATSWQKNLKPLVEDLLDEHVEVRFGTTPVPVENSVEMTVDVCQEEDKEEKLAELLGNVLKEKTDRAVVFSDTKWKVGRDRFPTETTWLARYRTSRQAATKRARLGRVYVLKRSGERARDDRQGFAGP